MRLSASSGSKTSKQDSKMDQNSKAGPPPKRAIQHFPSADQHKCRARLEGFWIEINLILFYFLEIRTCPSLYSDHIANFSNHSHPYKQRVLLKIQHTFSRFLTPPPFLLFSSFLFSLMLKTFWRLLPKEFLFCKQNILGFKAN